MPLLSSTNIKTLDYQDLGMPGCFIVSKTIILTGGLDYQFLGKPIAINVGASSLIKTIGYSALAGLKTVLGLPIASMKTIGGQSQF